MQSDMVCAFVREVQFAAAAGCQPDMLQRQQVLQLVAGCFKAVSGSLHHIFYWRTATMHVSNVAATQGLCGARQQHVWFVGSLQSAGDALRTCLEMYKPRRCLHCGGGKRAMGYDRLRPAYASMCAHVLRLHSAAGCAVPAASAANGVGQPSAGQLGMAVQAGITRPPEHTCVCGHAGTF